MSQLCADPSTAAYVESVARSSRGDVTGARRLLSESLGIDPSNQDARFEPHPELAHRVVARHRTRRHCRRSCTTAVRAGRAAAGQAGTAVRARNGRHFRAWTQCWLNRVGLIRGTPECACRCARIGDCASQIRSIGVVWAAMRCCCSRNSFSPSPAPSLLSLAPALRLRSIVRDILLESINGYAESVGAMVNYFARADLPGVRGTLESLNIRSGRDAPQSAGRDRTGRRSACQCFSTCATRSCRA